MLVCLTKTLRDLKRDLKHDLKRDPRKLWLLLTAIAALLVIAAVAPLGIKHYHKWRHVTYMASALPVVQTVNVTVSSGATLASIASSLADQGVIIAPRMFVKATMREGKDRSIRFGKYSIKAGMTVSDLLDKFVEGTVVHESLTIVEGSTFARVLSLLAADKRVKKTLPDDLEAAETELLGKIGLSGKKIEGLLFPDTYAFQEGESDVKILAVAYRKMRDTLAREWPNRDPGLPYLSAHDALVLASIIEKEAGNIDEMNKIASVFINRLRRSMPLQSDPTVIYSLGKLFTGNLLRSHLATDAEHNTYIHKGLPPTPIAMPSLAALRSALHPAETKFLYFVADGSGGHYFSRSLHEHNNAVNKYQRTGKGN